MGASIITGYTGTRHITPEMDGAVYRGIIGDDSYILAEGDQCEGSMPSVNQFTVKSGVVSIQGRQIYLTQETLAVDTCPTGYKRIDLVCARFEHDTTSLIDQASLIVIKGAEVSGGNDPVEPAHNEGVIKDGATVVDFVMYRLDLDGANVEITKEATVQSSLYMSKETQEKWNGITENGASLDQIMAYLSNECTLQTTTVTRASGWSEGINWVKKKFGIVQMYFEVSGGSVSSSGWITLGTLPEGFRPRGTYIDMVNLDNQRSSDCCIKIGTGGAIQVYKTSTLSNNFRLYAMFTTW